MRLRLAVIMLAVALVAATGGAAAVLAGGDADGPGQAPEPNELRMVRAHPVSSPPALTAAGFARPSAKAAGKRRSPALAYLETDPQTLAAGPTGFRIGNCPRRAKAINGYYYVAGIQTGFGLDAQGDSPIRGLRQWAFYLENSTDAPIGGVTFGLICLKNVG